MKLNKLILLSSMLIASSYLYGEELHPNTDENGSVDIINNQKNASPEVVYNILVNNAPELPQYPNLPRFAIVGKDNMFYLNIGATLKATSAFDWNNPLDDPSLFIPSNLTQAQAGNGGEIQFTVKRTRLHFNFVALPQTKNQLGVFISMNFTGNANNYGASLHYAYMKYRGFVVGYKTTLYADEVASPYTIDSEGPNSSPGITNTCIDYNHIISNFQMGVGLEMPLYSVTHNSTYYSINQRIPDIPLYIQYGEKNKGHIRLSAVLRNLYSRNFLKNDNYNTLGWGLKISGFYNCCSYVTAYYMGQYGKGIASYLQDNYGLGLDMVPVSATYDKLNLTKSWGAYLGLQFNLSKKVFSTLLYSHLRNYLDSYPNISNILPFTDRYKWGQYACANIICSPNKYIQFGMEYLYGRRMNFDKTQIHDNRLQAMFQVTF